MLVIIVNNNHKLLPTSVMGWKVCGFKDTYLMLDRTVVPKILHRRLIMFHIERVYSLINFGNPACFGTHKTHCYIKVPGKSCINTLGNFYIAHFFLSIFDHTVFHRERYRLVRMSAHFVLIVRQVQ